MTQVASSYSWLTILASIEKVNNDLKFQICRAVCVHFKKLLPYYYGSWPQIVFDLRRWPLSLCGTWLSLNMQLNGSFCSSSCASLSSISGCLYPKLLSWCQCKEESPRLSSHLPLLFALFPYGVCQRLSVCMSSLHVCACVCMCVLVCVCVCICCWLSI